VPASLGARLGRSANPSSLQDVARDSDLIRLRDQVFQLQRTQENLENQLKLKDQIIAMLAHDLRNPLTATAIALETLEMSHSEESGWSSRLSPALTAQILRNARTQTQTIDRMVTEILQTARGSQTGMQLNPSTLDVCNLCRVAIASLGEQFERKSQTLQLDLPQDMPVVLADGEQVRQVLLNLLDNASKYTPNGGEISVSVLHRTTQKVQISIADTGPGIPPENRDHIFEDRFRLERDVSQDGYGIGLSFCQRIIQAHYGQIWVDPLPQGSCFRFTLPVFKP
jgi:two-component system, OmpR family, clock-associated histidine kinase SasA